MFALLIMGGASSYAGNHYLEITTNSVKDNTWEWAIWYQLDTPLESGKTYVLTMDAKCSETYSMAFWPNNTENSKTLYTGYSIGTEWATCTCEFTANDALNRLSWNFGSLNGKLYFDNVKLVEKGYTTNLMEGGDFEEGLHANWGNDGWNSPVYSVYESSYTPARFLKITTNEAKANAWEWAIWYQLDTPLESGKTYVLTMDAQCSEAYSMSFWPKNTEEGGKTLYTGYNIGTEWGTCRCEFTANDNLNRLVWDFGSLNGTLRFDNVKLVEKGSSTDLMGGGDFENGLSANWGNDGWNKPEYAVVLEYPSAKAIVPQPEVQLTKSMFKGWDSPESGATITSNTPFWNANDYGVSGENGAVIYGNSNVGYLQYADLSDYSGMKIYGTGSDLRVLMNRVSDGGALTEVRVTPSSGGTYLDFSSYGYVHLNAIKVVNGGGTTTVDNITLIDPTASTEADYVFSGDLKDGEITASVTDALNDASARVYDIRDAGETGLSLISTNPNALFLANSGQLTNTQNVIVSGTCANLVLEDGHPFKAPFDFTATSASYTTTINTTAQAGTLCLPFAATIPGGVEAWTLNYTSGDKATATPVETTIPANTPVLLNGSGSAVFTGESVAIDADASNTSGALTGVFAATTVPENSYVLQDGDSGLGFYKVTSAITANPFRAYLTAEGAPAKMRIVYPSDEANDIDEVEIADEADDDAPVVNVAGQVVDDSYKGIVIKAGKKYLRK